MNAGSGPRRAVLAAALVVLALGVAAAGYDPSGSHTSTPPRPAGPTPPRSAGPASSTTAPLRSPTSGGPVRVGGSPVAASRIAGLAQVGFRMISTSAPRPALRCALLATTTAQQNRGLMGRTSLDGYAGMIFAWSSPTETPFYMKDTLIPLSIAWFGTGGDFLFSTTMTPCPPATAQCTLYGPGVPFVYALEVTAGGLDGVGAVPGASLQLSASC